MSDDSDITTMRLMIVGRVQGVGFRAFAMREAQALGLKGWVRNRADGSVEAVATGPTQAIKDFVGKCTRGPAAARVAHIDLESVESPEETGFVSKPTL
jgi:acylphosphatase